MITKHAYTEFTTNSDYYIKTKQFEKVFDYIHNRSAIVTTLLQFKYGDKHQSILFYLIDSLLTTRLDSDKVNYDVCLGVIYKLVHLLGDDVTKIRDANNNTLMHAAVEAKSDYLSQFLMKFFPKMRYLENNNKQNPGELAEKKSYVPIQQFILNKIDRPLIWVPRRRSKTFKGYRRDAKKYLEHKSKQIKTYQIVRQNIRAKKLKPTVITALMSSIYMQDLTRYDEIKQSLITVYQNPILQPLLKISALLAVQNYQNNQNKKLKIFIVNNKDISNIYPSTDALGISSRNRSVYVAGDESFSADSIVRVVLHELMHYVCRIVFVNKALPYFYEDQLSEDRATALVNVVLKLYERKSIQSYPNDSFQEAYSDLIGLATYSKYNYTKELVARLPEIFARLASDQAVIFFQEYLPDAIEYYNSCINDRFNDHLNLCNFSDIIDDELSTTQGDLLADGKVAHMQL